MLKIRVANPEDYAAIDSFDPFGGDRKAEIANGNCLIASLDQTVVGYVSHYKSGFVGRPFISFLAVSPEHRRQGIATRLLADTEQFFAGERVFISTEDTNQGMLALLKKLGWVDAGGVREANRDGSDKLFYYRDL